MKIYFKNLNKVFLIMEFNQRISPKKQEGKNMKIDELTIVEARQLASMFN
jgi:hypothetical protein